jgi:hypothetical protein
LAPISLDGDTRFPNALCINVTAGYPATSTMADHRELAVNHVFRFSERCEDLGVVADAHTITTRRWSVNSAEKLAKTIVASYLGGHPKPANDGHLKTGQ